MTMKKTNTLALNKNLLRHIRMNLNEFNNLTHQRQGEKRAAVAITVVSVSHDSNVYGMSGHEYAKDNAALILTRRTEKLKQHSGQWAFPGGSLDQNETPEDAALRELSEEVGLVLGRDRILGRLDDFTTRSGFIITPVVIWGGSDVNLRPNPAEVKSIHRIPIKEFMREDAPILHDVPGNENPILLMPVGNSWIAAPTAALIYQFREVAILGRNTRVAHFEQPLFAWQ
ncbi:MAG: CoA pyrophosphatase [Desulfobacterales bacterium]